MSVLGLNVQAARAGNPEHEKLIELVKEPLGRDRHGKGRGIPGRYSCTGWCGRQREVSRVHRLSQNCRGATRIVRVAAVNSSHRVLPHSQARCRVGRHAGAVQRACAKRHGAIVKGNCARWRLGAGYRRGETHGLPEVGRIERRDKRGCRRRKHNQSGIREITQRPVYSAYGERKTSDRSRGRGCDGQRKGISRFDCSLVNGRPVGNPATLKLIDVPL